MPEDMLDDISATGGGGEGADPAWAAHDHYRLLSLPLELRSVDAGFAEAARWHLAPFQRIRAEPESRSIDVLPSDGTGRAGPALLYVRDGLTASAGSPSEILEYALWDIYSLVPQWCRDFLFLHAGVVASNGQALMLPAARDTGKSTLVAALLEAGCSYLSDEFGAIDPVTGQVYPLEKRISLDQRSLRFFTGLEDRLEDRRGGSEHLRQRYVRPEDLDATVAGPAVPRWLVFPTGDREGAPRLLPLPRAEAVNRLAACSFNLYRYGERGVVLLSRLAEAAEAFQLDGGTPPERAALLSRRLMAG